MLKYITATLIAILAISYVSSNMFYVDNNSAAIAIFSWLAIIILLSLFSVKQDITLPHKVIFAVAIPILFICCRCIWFLNVTSEDFIAYTRLESYLEAYQSTGHIVILDEHGVYYNLHLLSHILSTLLFGGNRVLYINMFIILEWAMAILTWMIILKYYKLQTHIAFTILALLSSYIAGIIMRSTAIFQTMLLMLLMHQLIQRRWKNLRTSLILLLMLSIYISMEGLPARLILGIILSLIILFSLFQTKHPDSPKIILFTTITILPIFTTIAYDYYSLMYLARYTEYIYVFVERSLRFLFGAETPSLSPLGFSSSAMQFPYPLNVMLTITRSLITLSYVLYVVIALFMSVNYMIKKENDVILRSIFTTYLIFIALSVAGYFAQFTATKPFDYFILIQPRFLPIILVLMLALNTPRSPRFLMKTTYSSKIVFIAVSLFTFTSLMATMMLLYLNNDAPSGIIIQEVLSPLGHSGYSYDIHATLSFLRDYGPETHVIINVNQKVLCFLYSYISRGQLCKEVMPGANSQVIYQSSSYVLELS